ncbi:MAG: dihydroorotase [Coriobacteriales bacterium]|jgi:dihydroorotase|nr:dihydroorotase [Coriobacteriales bacterium]
MLLLKGARCIDPRVGLDAITDILIRDGSIAAVGADLPVGDDGLGTDRPLIRDLSGRVILPGLMDMHVHLREPGQEYKEDIASAARAAAQGGFVAVLAMPNTQPVTDSASRVAFVLDKARYVGVTRVHVAGALSRDLAGESLAEIGDMYKAGAVAFTDDGRGLQDCGLMRLAMDYVHQFACPVLSHCELESLVGSGVVHEGIVSTRLGLAGWPAAGEEIQIARDIALAELSGCALHIQHITTAVGLKLVREAKERGLPVSCEVTAHHLFLNENDLNATYDTNLKMNPPLRTTADNQALQEALIEGLIDVVASDHAPHAAHEKALEFERAPFGCTGLETTLSLLLTELVGLEKMSYQRLVECLAHAPRRILGLEEVGIVAGSPADLTVIDPGVRWQVEAENWQSKSANNAFIGQQLQGRASDVYVRGIPSMIEGTVCDV